MPTQRHLPSQIENFGHAKVHKCRAPCQSANLSPLTGAGELMSGTSRASVGFGGGGLSFAWQQPKISILIDRRKWMDRQSWDSPYYTLRTLCQMDGKSTAATFPDTNIHPQHQYHWKKGSAPWLSFLASILLDQRSIPNCSPGISPHESCTKILGFPPDSSEETKLWRIWRGLKNLTGNGYTACTAFSHVR